MIVAGYKLAASGQIVPALITLILSLLLALIATLGGKNPR